ncbi:hypothetical protein FDR95_12090 [Rhizobiaceae bacterium LC148]|nr:hypothetical protein FDR95_12090 [Rhizobiaceae bacterium LC148]
MKMAEQLGRARSTVQASIDRLVDMGVLEKHVEESKDGRDSAHFYRVIYDRAPPSGYDFDAYQEVDDKENDPIAPASDEAPPAGTPAPPAGPGAAPPAGSGPAPINDPYLTAPSEREERERGRDDGEGEEDRRALERRFRKWWSTWPTYAVDAEIPTRRAWLDLTPEQRKACEERTPDYLAAAKASGRKFSKAGATYLSERAWERLGEITTPAAGGTTPERHNPYSRPWSALRLAELSRPPMPLTLTPLEAQIIENKPEKEDVIWRDKREKSAWPEAVRLNQAARERRPVAVPPHIVALSSTFDKVEVGGEIWEAWKRLHHERCWPWLPEPNGLPFVQFPALPDGIDDPDEAVAEALRQFQRQLIERRENDAA